MSSSTLVHGMELATLDLNELLNVKMEPDDEEEREMQREMQAQTSENALAPYSRETPRHSL